MTAVGRTAHHHVLAVDLSWEHNAVSVKWEVCIFTLLEGLEICCCCNADSWLPAVCITPCNDIFVFELANTWVVAVLPLCNFRNITFKVDSFFVNIPVDTVLGETNVEFHASSFFCLLLILNNIIHIQKLRIYLCEYFC